MRTCTERDARKDSPQVGVSVDYDFRIVDGRVTNVGSGFGKVFIAFEGEGLAGYPSSSIHGGLVTHDILRKSYRGEENRLIIQRVTRAAVDVLDPTDAATYAQMQHEYEAARGSPGLAVAYVLCEPI